MSYHSTIKRFILIIKRILREEGQRYIFLKFLEGLKHLQGIYIVTIGYIRCLKFLPYCVYLGKQIFRMADHFIDHFCSFCVDLSLFILILDRVIINAVAHKIVVPSVNRSLHLAIIILKK